MPKSKGKSKGTGKGARGGRGRKRKVQEDEEEEQQQQQHEQPQQQQDEDQEDEEIRLQPRRGGEEGREDTVEAGGEDTLPADDAVAEGSSATTTPRKRKARRPKAAIPVLTEEQEEDTVEWIRKHDVLFNRSNKRFQDVHYIDGLWQDQASRLNISPEELKVWWDSLRTRWGRLAKPGKSGAGVATMTDREARILQSLAF